MAGQIYVKLMVS